MPRSCAPHARCGPGWCRQCTPSLRERGGGRAGGWGHCASRPPHCLPAMGGGWGEPGGPLFAARVLAGQGGNPPAAAGAAGVEAAYEPSPVGAAFPPLGPQSWSVPCRSPITASRPACAPMPKGSSVPCRTACCRRQPCPPTRSLQSVCSTIDRSERRVGGFWNLAGTGSWWERRCTRCVRCGTGCTRRRWLACSRFGTAYHRRGNSARWSLRYVLGRCVGWQGGGAFVRCAAPAGASSYYLVRGDGSLRQLPAMPALPDGARWVQACVLQCTLPGQRASQGRQEDEEDGPATRPCLLDAWSEVVVDPTVWGMGKHDLCSFTVRCATQRRIQLRAQHEAGAWYTPGVGCRPALWAPPAGAPSSSRPSTGLQVLEGRWLSSYERGVAEQQRPPDRRRSAEWAVELLPCQRPGKTATAGCA